VVRDNLQSGNGRGVSKLMATNGVNRKAGEYRTKGEQLGIPITENDVKETRTIGANCLVGRLWAEKKVNREAFKSVMTRIWRAEGCVVFNEIQDNLWIFEFTNGDIKERMMANRPWSFDRQILVLNYFDKIIPLRRWTSLILLAGSRSMICHYYACRGQWEQK
jgi:hypothetical protein